MAKRIWYEKTGAPRQALEDMIRRALWFIDTRSLDWYKNVNPSAGEGRLVDVFIDRYSVTVTVKTNPDRFMQYMYGFEAPAVIRQMMKMANHVFGYAVTDDDGFMSLHMKDSDHGNRLFDAMWMTEGRRHHMCWEE